MDSTGAITGTPTQAGTYNFVIRATEVTGGRRPVTTTFDQQFTLTVAAGTAVEEPALTKEDVQAMIDQAIANLPADDSLTEAEIKALIDEAIDGIQMPDTLTEAEVQAMIDAAMEKDSSSGGCNSSVAFTGSAIAFLVAAAGITTAIFVRRRNKN